MVKVMVSLVFLAVLVAACVSPLTPVPAPTQTPLPPTPADAPLQPPPAALAVQKRLADRLGVGLDEIKIVAIEEEQWPDGCLGLGRPDESCLLAITPGYHVVLVVNGESYQFRTDLAGEQIREANAPTAHNPALNIKSVINGLARYLKAEPNTIKFVSNEPAEWSDSCLGYPNPAELCAQVITPGFRVTFKQGDTTYEVHTDAQMSRARLPGGIDLIAAP